MYFYMLRICILIFIFSVFVCTRNVHLRMQRLLLFSRSLFTYSLSLKHSLFVLFFTFTFYMQRKQSLKRVTLTIHILNASTSTLHYTFSLNIILHIHLISQMCFQLHVHMQLIWHIVVHIQVCITFCVHVLQHMICLIVVLCYTCTVTSHELSSE